MTLEEAKEFYFQYNGFSFHMDREEPVKYNRFKMLDPGKDTLRKWDEELLENLFRDLWTNPDRIWVSHGTILGVIRRNMIDAEKYLNRLLDEMEKMESLRLFVLTLIIENMAGRNEPMNDGGVFIICKYSNLAARMNAIMEHLIGARSSDPDVDERFKEAVCRFRKAYSRWHNLIQ